MNRWPDGVVVAVATAAALGLAAWAALTWSDQPIIPRALLVLPMGLVIWRLGRRAAWAALAGALFLVACSLAWNVASGAPLWTSMLEGVMLGGFFSFVTWLLAVRLEGGEKQAESPDSGATAEALRRSMDALSGLRRVSREISATVELERVLYLVLEEAMRLSEAAMGAVAYRETAGGEWLLTEELCSGYSEEEVLSIRAALRAPDACVLLADVMRSQKPAIVSSSAGETSGFGTEARASLVVPVSYQEALEGLIILESSSANAFDPQALEFVEGLAAQAAIAIGNHRRYREQVERQNLLSRRADQLAQVLEISRALRSDRPLDEILEEIAYAAQEGVGFDVVWISVLTGDPPYQRWAAAAGVSIPVFERMKETRQPWAAVSEMMRDEFRISQSYYIPAEHGAQWRDLLGMYEVSDEAREPGRWRAGDVLLVPLIGSGGDVRGLLLVSQPQDDRVPDRTTVEALEIFAAQAALAIENAQLVEALRRRADTLALFNEVSRSVTAKLELDEVLETVVEMAPRLLGYDYSSVFLLEADSGCYFPRAAHGFALNGMSRQGFAPGEGPVGQVAASGMPLAIDDLAQEPGRACLGSLGDMGSVVLCPLMGGEQTVGVLCVGYREAHRFSPAEVATLSALADQVAVAVEHARLFDQVSRFSHELERRVEERTRELAKAMDDLKEEHARVESLYRITAQIASSLDLDHVLNRSLQMVMEAVGAEQAFTLLLEQETGKLLCRAAMGTRGEETYVGEPIRFSRGEGLAGWAVAHRKAAIVPDTRLDARWVKSQSGAQEYRSALVVPLVAGDEVLGALLLFHPAPDYFNEDHLRLVEAAGTQVANAIHNAELYRLILDQTDSLGRMLRAQEVEATKSQAILEGVADGVLVTDAQGQIILFNAAAERILGLPRDQALGRMTSEMLGLYGGQAREWMEAIARWAEHPETYRPGEYLATRVEIEKRVVSIHLAPVMAGDEFLGTVSVFRDVTAEVEAERAKTEFVSMVSHELRTPMTSIKGYTDLMLMGATGALTETQSRFLSIIKSNTDRLTMLVNDLLDISRIESGRMKLSLSIVHVEDVVSQVLSAMEAKVVEKGLTLHSDLPEVLPPVYADPDRVIQILTNLVANAYYYTPTGGEIRVSARAYGEEVHISVQDTGIGISRADQERLFSRFFRSEDPVVQEAPGTGLGLSIVKSLVEMHRGRVWVQSELGQGSTFTFTLLTEQGWRAAQKKADSGGLVPAKVLVVEDDRDIAGLLQLHLAGDGREVMVAHTGRDALELARRERPDLITLDVLLPDMDGFDVLEELKSNPATQEIPVIVVSVVPDQDKGLRLGAVDYVAKPIDEQQLMRAVRQVLLRRGTVLVVDDDKDTLSLMSSVLRAHKFGVQTASQGGQALHLAAESRPALILLDIKLPDIDGYTVLKQLKDDPATRDIPVIVMTGSAAMDEVNRQKVIALGAARFVSKPFSIEELIAEIESVMWGNGHADAAS